MTAEARRIAIIGSGAVGSYYGARLAEAGHEVHFLMRSHLDHVVHDGLHVESPHGAIHIEHPLVHDDPTTIGAVDWVLCALKSTALEAARDLIAPCVAEGGGTRILALMNGLGVEDRLGEWFGLERVFGGLAFTCINRDERGWIHHLDYGEITIGHAEDDPAEVETARALWEGTAVGVHTTPSLLAARWTKLCWNIPFNGLAVTAGGITTDVIMHDPALRAEAEALIREIVATGNADLEARGGESAPRLDPDTMVADMLARTDAMAVYRPSTMIDFVEGRPMEVETIFGEPLRRARALSLDTPRMALLYAQMRALDARTA